MNDKIRSIGAYLIILFIFLAFGCVTTQPKSTGNFNGVWDTEKIRTAMLAARVIETRANIKYDVEEKSEAKPYVQSGLALMIGDGLLLTLKHISEVPKSKSVQTPWGWIDMPLVADNIEHFLDGEQIDLIGTFDDIAIFDTHKQIGQMIRFGNSDAIRIGDPVLLIGRSFSQGLNVKIGIVSNTIASQYGGENVDLSICFLLTVPMNYGDSGGMVFNSTFELIGIANATGPGVNISFAIKINEVKDCISRILKK